MVALQGLVYRLLSRKFLLAASGAIALGQAGYSWEAASLVIAYVAGEASIDLQDVRARADMVVAEAERHQAELDSMAAMFDVESGFNGCDSCGG